MKILINDCNIKIFNINNNKNTNDIILSDFDKYIEDSQLKLLQMEENNEIKQSML